MSHRKSKSPQRILSFNNLNNEVPADIAGDGFVEIDRYGRIVDPEFVHAHEAGKLNASQVEEIIIDSVHKSSQFTGDQRLIIINFLKELLTNKTGILKNKLHIMLRDGKKINLKFIPIHISAYIKKSRYPELVNFMGDHVGEIVKITKSCFDNLSRKAGVGKLINKGTKHKGTKRKGTKRKGKGTNHKGTNHKGKGTNHKGTNHKGTNRGTKHKGTKHKGNKHRKPRNTKKKLSANIKTKRSKKN